MATLHEVASAAFPVLVDVASRHATVTYGELAAEIDTSAYFVLPRALGHIWSWCADNGYPHINALVVSQRTGIPGGGYQPNGRPLDSLEWSKLRDDVYGFSRWSDLVPPVRWPATRCA